MSRIPVVDDDPMICMAFEIYLARHGFQVTIAEGGDSGLIANASSPKCDWPRL